MPSKLTDLANKRFEVRGLWPAEEQMLGATQAGEDVLLAHSGPSSGTLNIVDERCQNVVRAETIAWVCTSSEAIALVSHRGIRLHRARVEGALNLNHARIPFPLFFFDSVFTERILLIDAHLQTLSLSASSVPGIYADRAVVSGTVLLRDGFRCSGELRFAAARISGNLECDAAIIGNGVAALNAEAISVGGNIFLRNGFKSHGVTSLLGASVQGSLNCDDADFQNPGGVALIADRAQLRGGVRLCGGFTSVGEMRFMSASVGVNFEADNASFSNPNGRALRADKIRVQDNILLRDARVEGDIRIVGASVGGNLEFDRGYFSATHQAIMADSATIDGSIYLRDGITLAGEVNLAGATIGNHLVIRGLANPAQLKLNVTSAKAAGLWDSEESWPSSGNLHLDGFSYEHFYKDAPSDASRRLRWLGLQPRDEFHPQPYQQLAKTMREMGHERDARSVMVKKNRERARFTKRFGGSWWWYNFFGPIVGYGYRPAWAFWESLAAIAVGTLLFWLGSCADLVSPTKDNAYVKDSNGNILTVAGKAKLSATYPLFTPIAYSAETFVPVLELDQEENWMPNANRGARLSRLTGQLTTGQLLLWYLRLHIISGWVLTTLWVGAITGLAKT